MEIMEFCEKVKRNLMKDIEEGMRLSVKQVMKNNGVILHGIMISKKGMNISPNIYLDGLHASYEAGETFQTVMGRVRRIYEESRMETSIDLDFFLDYGHMKDRVVYKAVGAARNRELLRQVPHILFLDMALVFYCQVPGEALGYATILIYNNHLKMWGITKERLYWDAQKNTPCILPAQILSMEEVIRDIFEEGMDGKVPGTGADTGRNTDTGKNVDSGRDADTGRNMDDGRMYVLGNESKLFGAAAMFYNGVLEGFSDKTGKNFFILPSSVHEVILIPDDGLQDGRELLRMVCEINATQVEEEEVLTDSVYYFSRKSKKIKKMF